VAVAAAPTVGLGGAVLMSLRQRVLLLSRVGDHHSALRVLALLVGDVDASVAYCKQQRRRALQRREEQREEEEEGGAAAAGGDGAGGEDAGGEGQESPQQAWLALLELLLK
jgi:hypothetical protein